MASMQCTELCAESLTGKVFVETVCASLRSMISRMALSYKLQSYLKAVPFVGSLRPTAYRMAASMDMGSCK